MDESMDATFLTELSKDNSKIGYRLKKLPPIKSNSESEIDYDNMKLLTKHIENGKSPEDNHKFFMENYQMIFKTKTEKLAIEESKMSQKSSFAERSVKNARATANARLPENIDNHNISVHLSKIRKHAGSPIKEAVSDERLKIIRKIAKKLPLDRSTKENQQLQQCLSNIDCFTRIPNRVLSRLVATAQLEKWDPNYTVFGDSGLYLILKGTVSPQSPVLYVDKDSIIREESTTSLYSGHDSTLQSLFKLGVGDYFGTLEKVKETQNTRYLSVITCEDCELLRFSNTSYERVVKQVKEKEDTEKLQLAQSCNIFKDWPVLALKKVSEKFTWSKIAGGENLLLEGEIAQHITFIKTGRCLLKKKLSVAFTYPDGRKVKKRKELVTGTLTTGDSFGEWSFISGLPAEQSVISDTPLEIIKKQYIEKQAELDWQAKKDGIVNETLYYRGIMPGYSKWSRNPSLSEIQRLSADKT